MNKYITIAHEAIGLTGYQTISPVETLDREKALRKLERKKILRRFTSPFDSSVEIVVI